ncbi:MAG: DUF2079 domain-containing protein [Caldilineales bacterium]|nr:DUF2079 domain-containing protein [Caldilineales bacterium]
MNNAPQPRGTQPGRPPRWAMAALWLMVAAYALYFSALSIRQHEAHRTHRADLGQIDQAIWNTSQGRFVQEIKGDQVSTRLTDHVEPIFALVAPVFWVWDDVRALLVVQSVALAVGAWPVFSLAWQRFGSQRQQGLRSRRYLGLLALAFALAYLLYPPLQAANVAEFHALPLATPFILFAFLFAARGQWVRFALAALLVAAVQEGTALLAAALGVYALVLGLRLRRQEGADAPAARAALAAGGLVLVGGLAWFYLATFVVIPAHAAEAYGLSETPYAARFGALGDSFGDVLRSLVTRPLLVLQIALEPMRIAYALRLLAPVGFLALFAPDYLALGLPLFLANLLSGFAFQYSGQLHYSAPLAAYALVAAVVGSHRLRSQARRVVLLSRHRRLWRAHHRYLFLIGWLVVWSLGSQAAWGYTPIGRQFRYYWPPITDHHRLLARFIAQIPADAAVATTDVLYPHLSHRQRIYSLPTVADAEYVLMDLAAQTGWAMHPTALRDQVAEMIGSGQWRVQDGADGYLLLARQASPVAGPSPWTAALPDEFFTFARPAGEPQVKLDVTFDGRLRLVGYDLLEDRRWRTVGFRLYWQALEPLPPDTQLRLFVLTPDGQEVDSTDLRPFIQPLWFPPEAWPVGETVVVARLPWYLPKEWAPAVGVHSGGSWEDVGRRWPAVDRTPADAADTALFEGNTWVRLAPQRWERSRLVPAPPPALKPADALFGGDGWTARLTGVALPPRTAPDSIARLVLRWEGSGPALRDYTVFVHVRDAADRNVAQGDAPPRWFGPLPTSQWAAGQPVVAAYAIQVPADLPPGRYRLVIGWYYWETLERLALLGADGLPVGDSLAIGELEVDATARPAPDLACAVAAEACASQ